MSFFTDLQTALDALRSLVGDHEDATRIAGAVAELGDDAVVSLIAAASALVRGGESLRIAGSGVVAARSTREHGHGGLAQSRGHRSPVALIQELTGTTRSDAARQVRLGETLAGGKGGQGAEGGEGGDGGHGGPAMPDLAGAPDAPQPDGAGTARDDTTAPAAERPWHATLGDALMNGAITCAQHDAILRGLGEPPRADAARTMVESSPEHEGPDDEAMDATALDDAAPDASAAWAAAATHLIDEASHRTVEELAQAARTVRDILDPAGAERRFDERFHGRSFRLWTDHDGVRRGSFTFDDEAAAWVAAVIDSALRPRRGGPRFVGPEERARAEELTADPRTNDQLAYDLLIDVLRAGSLAEAGAVFGARQAGVRLVLTTASAAAVEDGRPAVGHLTDDRTALPGWLVARHACTTGTLPCTVDGRGRPLDLGREVRLFTPAQRVALALRDGGCRWRGCDRPPSFCEAHHIDHWHRDGGRTDVDRGILLCRFHHMQLHHGGWRITRDGAGNTVLHHPDRREGVPLPPRTMLRYAWGDLRPPPPRLLRPGPTAQQGPTARPGPTAHPGPGDRSGPSGYAPPAASSAARSGAPSTSRRATHGAAIRPSRQSRSTSS